MGRKKCWFKAGLQLPRNERVFSNMNNRNEGMIPNPRARFFHKPNLSGNRTFIQEKPIQAVPFSGFPEINAQACEGYDRSVLFYIKDNLRASEELNPAMSALMINLLAGLENRVIQPGRKFGRTERDFLRRQLNHYQDAITCLDLSFRPYLLDKNISFGRFSHVEQIDVGKKRGTFLTGRFNILDYMKSPFWTGTDKRFDLIYAGNPNDLYEDTGDIKEEIGKRTMANFDADNSDLVGKFKELEKTMTDEEKRAARTSLEQLEGCFDKVDALWESFSVKGAEELLREVEGLPSRSELETLMKRAVIGMSQLFLQACKEYRDIVSEPQEVTRRLVPLSKDRGILLVNGGEVYAPAGARYVGRFGSVDLYQKGAEIKTSA